MRGSVVDLILRLQPFGAQDHLRRLAPGRTGGCVKVWAHRRRPWGSEPRSRSIPRTGEAIPMPTRD